MSTMTIAATFDATGRETNAAFGQVTPPRDSRRIHLAVRFTL